MTVLGIDTSKWDGNWDAGKAKQAGASFVYIKSSQAVFTDVQFVASWKKAREAGLMRGAYHYMDYTKPAISQAKYFADLLKDDPGELPPTVDYEQRRSDNSPTIALGFLRDFLDYMKGRSELYAKARIKVPMIYTGPAFWAEYGDKTKRDYWLQFPLWIANYTTAAAPQIPAPWTMWNFWQFSSRGPGEVFGSESLSIDMNRFNGTMNELLEFAGLQGPVTVVTQPATELEKRTTILEETVAKLKLSSDGKLISRVEDLEQQNSSLARTITTSHALLEQRLTSIEQKLSNLSTWIPDNYLNVSSKDTESPGDNTVDPVSDPESASNYAADPVSDPESASKDTVDPVSDPVSASGTPTGDPGVYATCKVTVLNVRSGPGTSHPAVANLGFGQQVKILNREGGWAQIEQPAGWAYEPYLSFDQNNPDTTGTPVDSPATAPASASATYGVCNTSGLNVRSSPASTYPIVGGLTYGQRVKIIDRHDGWAQIETPSGWCNESYLSFN